eukprot:6639264-Alexandrium_andersonii.AAC.1
MQHEGRIQEDRRQTSKEGLGAPSEGRLGHCPRTGCSTRSEHSGRSGHLENAKSLQAFRA